MRSLYLFQCSLHRHSLESLIALCSDLEFLSIVGVHYGHIVSAIHLPTGCPEVANRLIKVVHPASSLPIAIDSWHHASGIISFIADTVSSPPPPALKYLHVNFPDSLPRIFSPESNVEGTPPLLNQLFVPAGMPSCVKSFLHGAEVYPVWLQLGGLQNLDICLSLNLTSIFSNIMASVGSTLTGLHLYFYTSSFYLLII